MNQKEIEEYLIKKSKLINPSPNRFIIPVDDIAGHTVALIGYYPDYKKYITTPSPFFSKECMFFNFRQAYDLSIQEFGGLVFLVEGIFDCLSLRADETVAISFSFCQGFRIKSVAPAFIALTAFSASP